MAADHMHAMDDADTQALAEETTDSAAVPMMSAGDLRSALRNLLGEHTLLTASTADAFLRGRTAEFDAAVAALDDNSVAVAEALGSVYGDEAAEAFLPLWRSHINLLVDYISGVSTDDQVKQQQALTDLDQMDMHATALADAISRQFPGLLTGSADSAAADLQAALNGLLAEPR